MTANVRIVNKLHTVKKYVDNSVLKTFGDAARLTRAIARSSIKRRVGDQPSLPGQPPRTRRGQMRNSILYDLDEKRQEALIGASFQRIGASAGAHEHGGPFKGQIFPARPFMKPAFEKIINRLPKMWRYSIR